MKRRGSVSALLLVLSVAGVAHAGSDEQISSAQHEISAVTSESGNVQGVIEKARSEQITVEQRIANGELLYRTKDYDRAEVVLSEVVDNFPDTPSYVDALWLRGETFYASKQYLSARRDYRALVKRGNEPRFQPYVGKALARLVDVSVRVNDVASLDEVFQNLGLVPPSQVDSALLYAEGKAYYLKQDYTTAGTKFAAVQPNTLYLHQARYYQGLLAMKAARQTAPVADPNAPAPAAGAPLPQSANYKLAIEAFKQVTVLPPDTDEHRHVIDLAWMAIGRLFYEMEQFDAAKDAYSKVGRESAEFDTMLFELAWVYVRLGDVQRAERALEVLAIADPDSEFIGEGTLLRADLLLRAGAFDKALALYQSVREQYDPQKVKVETFLSSTNDVSVYYDKLSQQEFDALDQTQALPALAIKWARDAEDTECVECQVGTAECVAVPSDPSKGKRCKIVKNGPLAFSIIDDVGRCKKLIKDSDILIEKLNALTRAKNRVRAFPELLAGEQLTLGLINRLSRARLSLARGLDMEEGSGELSGDIGGWQKQRRSLMDSMAALPTNSAEFSDRDEQGIKQWNTVSQALSRNGLEIDQLNAVVNGLRRMLREDAQHGVTRSPADLKRFNDEIDDNERLLREDREQVALLRRQIEVGRAQIGLGDKRYQDDRDYRTSFSNALDHEVADAIAGQGGGDAQKYAQRIQPLLAQISAQEETLKNQFVLLDNQSDNKIADLQSKIDVEAGHIAEYKITLGQYDNEARDLVGHVALRNFTIVRDKLRSIVLRADVGVTEQAWEVREEELDRVRNLQTERSREERLLDEELKEVLDDSADPGADKSKPASK